MRPHSNYFKLALAILLSVALNKGLAIDVQAELFQLPNYSQRAISGETINAQNTSPNYVHEVDTFWLKYTLTQFEPGSELLISFNGRWEFIDVFDSKGNLIGKTGRGLELTNRQLYIPSNVVRLSSLNQGADSLFVRFISTNPQSRPQSFGGQVISYVSYLENKQSDLYFQGFFVGIIVIMILYHLGLTVYLRDKNYFIYLIYLTSLFFITLGNYAFDFYLWPNAPQWQRFINSIPTYDMFCAMALIAFTKSFLQLKSQLPSFYWILNAILFLCLADTMAPLLGFISSSLAWQISGTLGIVIYSVILVAGVILMKRRYGQATLFVLGILFSTLGTVYFLLQSVYHIFPFELKTYPMQIGNAIDIALFSYALSKRVKDLKEESAFHKQQVQLEIQQGKLNALKARAETQNLERKRIAKDIHDDIGAGLSKVNLIAAKVMKHASEDKVVSESMRQISDTVHSVNTNMHDMVWLMNREQIELSTFCLKLREFTSDLFENYPANFKSDFPDIEDNRPMNKEAYRALFSVVKELTNNIIRHANATEITMDVKLKDSNLCIVIADNGKGVDLNSLTRVNGLKNVTEKVEGIEGVVDFVSKPNAGMNVRILVPLRFLLTP